MYSNLILQYNQGITSINDRVTKTDLDRLHIYTCGYPDIHTGELLSPVKDVSELLYTHLLNPGDITFISDLKTNDPLILTNIQRATESAFIAEDEVAKYYPLYYVGRIDIRSKDLFDLIHPDYNKIISDFSRYTSRSKNRDLNRIVNYFKSFEVSTESTSTLYKDKLHCHLTLFIDITDIEHGVNERYLETLLYRYKEILEYYDDRISCHIPSIKPCRWIRNNSLFLRNLARHWLSYSCKYSYNEERYRRYFNYNVHLFERGRVKIPSVY